MTNFYKIRSLEIIFFVILFIALFTIFFKWTSLPFYRDSGDFLMKGSFEIARTGNIFAYLNMTDYPHTPIMLILISFIYKLPINHIVWIHLLSLMFSLFFLIVMYFMGKTIAGPLVGIALSLSFITNPLFIAQTQMVYFVIIGTALRYLSITLLLGKKYNWFWIISVLAIFTMIDNGIYIICASLCYVILENPVNKTRWLLKYCLSLIFVVAGWLILHTALVNWLIYNPDRHFDEKFFLSIISAAKYTFVTQGRWMVGIFWILTFVGSLFLKKLKDMQSLNKISTIIGVLSIASLPQFLEIGKLGYFLERYSFPILPVYYLGVFILITCFSSKKVLYTLIVLILITAAQVTNAYNCSSKSLEDCSSLFTLLQQKKYVSNYLKLIPEDNNILVSDIDNADLTSVATGLVDRPLHANSDFAHQKPDYVYITPVSDKDVINFLNHNEYIPVYSTPITGADGQIGLYKNQYLYQ